MSKMPGMTRLPFSISTPFLCIWSSIRIFTIYPRTSIPFMSCPTHQLWGGPILAGLLITVAWIAFATETVSAKESSDNPNADCDELIDIYLPENPQHADYVMKIQYSDRLICLARNNALYRALLRRVGLDRKYRKEAIMGLADANDTNAITEWLSAVRRLDRDGAQLDPRVAGRNASDEEWNSLLKDYVALFSGLKPTRSQENEIIETMVELAVDGTSAGVRKLAYATIVNLDSGLDRAWKLANQSHSDIVDIFAAGPWISSEEIKRSLFAAGLSMKRGDPPLEREFIRFLAVVPGHDTEIFNLLRGYLETPLQGEAIRSLLNRDPGQWPLESVANFVDELTSIYSLLPPKTRTKGEGKQLVALLERLVDYLPKEKSAVLRARLEGLEVTEISLRAMREQMAFDKEVIVLQAGQPVEISFFNNDTMPHNIVIARPNSMETVGVAADQLAILQEAGDRRYVPDIEEVLYQSDMVESGRTATLSFVAPEKEGVYPMLCTFPGHWLKMFSAVVVTKDKHAYVASNNPLPSRDSLLGIKNYDHKYPILVDSLHKKDESRSFEKGKSAFYSRACVSCHMVGGKGGRVGPELTKLGEKQQSHDILRSILYPSEKIDPQYAKAEIEHLESGKIYAGVLIPQDDPDTIYLVEDPLSECEPVVFRRDEVDIVPLKVSPMPEGLLRRSSPEEVLDLVAFLVAGGDPEHPVFNRSDTDE